MTASIGSSARTAGNKAIVDAEGVSAAKSDLDNVAVFTKFIKKAEEVAQSAL